MAERGPCVVHVLGREKEQALQALARTMQVIATQAVAQVVLVLEQGRACSGFAAAAGAAEVRLLRGAGFSLARAIRALQSEFGRLSREGSLYAVHLHGWEACLPGSLALTEGERRARILYSPHRAHFGPPWAAALLGRLLQKRLAPFDHAVLAASPGEARALSRLLNRSAEVLLQPVHDAYFEAARREDARPGIIAQSGGAQVVDVVTRLCVLLNGREPRVRVSWMGEAGARPRAQLDAASVQALDPGDDAAIAKSLSRAWLFIAAAQGEGSPRAVARAMAAGVPCLVSDRPAHRALVHHGETGFVCTSEGDYLEKAVLLLRDAAERRRIGELGRAEAQRRFSEAGFGRAVLRAYRLPLVKSTNLEKERIACAPLERALLQG